MSHGQLHGHYLWVALLDESKVVSLSSKASTALNSFPCIALGAGEFTGTEEKEYDICEHRLCALGCICLSKNYRVCCKIHYLA